MTTISDLLKAALSPAGGDQFTEMVRISLSSLDVPSLAEIGRNKQVVQDNLRKLENRENVAKLCNLIERLCTVSSRMQKNQPPAIPHIQSLIDKIGSLVADLEGHVH